MDFPFTLLKIFLLTPLDMFIVFRPATLSFGIFGPVYRASNKIRAGCRFTFLGSGPNFRSAYSSGWRYYV